MNSLSLRGWVAAGLTAASLTIGCGSDFSFGAPTSGAGGGGGASGTTGSGGSGGAGGSGVSASTGTTATTTSNATSSVAASTSAATSSSTGGGNVDKKIPCGNMNCPDVCCANLQQQVCVMDPNQCPLGTSVFQCNNGADCAPGLKCCATQTGMGTSVSQCASTCDMGIVFCAEDNECGPNQQCKTLFIKIGDKWIETPYKYCKSGG